MFFIKSILTFSILIGCPLNFNAVGDLRQCCTDLDCNCEPPVQCLKVLNYKGDFLSAQDGCSKEFIWYKKNSAKIISYTSNKQELLDSLTSGSILQLQGIETTFFFDCHKRDGQFFCRDDDWIPGFPMFYRIALINNSSNEMNCLAAKVDSRFAAWKLEIIPVNCNDSHTIICTTASYMNYQACDTQVQNLGTLDFLLNPDRATEKENAITEMRETFYGMMTRLDQNIAFDGLFSTLWYAPLPCFDIKNVTAGRDGEKAIIKYCEWKGVPISCAAIFSPYPTDQGICCSFNIKAANDIYNSGHYSQKITSLQNSDASSSFAESNLPDWYTRNSEPSSMPGPSKGLFLMLDAHMDEYGKASHQDDFDGFVGLIHPRGSFPIMSLEGLKIKPGHLNDISITATQVDANDDMKDINPDDRKCMFRNDDSDLQIHKEYTYYNCIFECSLFYAHHQVMHMSNVSVSCIPWFLPTPNNISIYFCNPWETAKFMEFMEQVPPGSCKCLPDCNVTIYQPSITSTPLRKCDSSNLGVSRLCNLNNRILPRPTMFANQILNELIKAPNVEVRKNLSRYAYDIDLMENRFRYYGKAMVNRDVFSKTQETYDSYEKDIALVQIFFGKSTIIQMGRKARMNWIDYFSTVGGLLGLVLGMGIVSVIEMFWVCLRLAALKLNLQNLVP